MEIVGKSSGNEDKNSRVIQISQVYKQESEQARRNREVLNSRNWDVYHMRQDWSHKREGQSRDFLPKQRMAVEQTTQFFQQGLMDTTDWWKAEYAPGVREESVIVRKEEVKKIVDRFLEMNNFIPLVGDCIKTGLLSSVIILKVYGDHCKKPFFVFEQELTETGEIKNKIKRGFREPWSLKFSLVQAENFYIDPSGKGLYEMEELYLDYFEVKRLSEGKNAIYDAEEVAKIGTDYQEDWDHKIDKARETNQNVPTEQRPKVKIQEFWGTVVDTVTGEILFENVTWTIANDQFLICKPKPNPMWTGESPYVVAPIIRVPGSVWHTAMMDAASANNITQNELWNLMVDGAMMGVYGIKQYRPDYMEDDSQADEGFYPGQSVAANSACPPGMKILERIDTSSVTQESLAMFQLQNAEFNVAAMTNDLRMGNLPGRSVKATEVVEANQSINSVFGGIAKVLEDQFIVKLLNKSWNLILQHIGEIDFKELKDLLGEERAMELTSISSEQVFSNMFGGNVFEVFGMSKTLSKMKDFRKLMTFLQTVAASPVLMQEFASKYSMQRLMEEFLRSLDINTERLKMDEREQAETQQRMMQAMMQQQMLNVGGNVGGGGAGTDQGNIPQAGSENTGSMGGGPMGTPQPNGPRR